MYARRSAVDDHFYDNLCDVFDDNDDDNGSLDNDDLDDDHNDHNDNHPSGSEAAGVVEQPRRRRIYLAEGNCALATDRWSTDILTVGVATASSLLGELRHRRRIALGWCRSGQRELR